MEDALVPKGLLCYLLSLPKVLILVVMEDALVPLKKNLFAQIIIVLILVVMEDALVP